MRFFILSGALTNAGDYLITERTKQLLQEVYPGCEFVSFRRKVPFTDKDIEVANECEAIVYAGGPCVNANLYPKMVPLVPQLDMLTSKIVSVGLGWSGKCGTLEEATKYRLSSQTIEMFNRMSKDAPKVSCRDYLTYTVLKSNGINNAQVMGCPAWYNLSYLAKNSEISELAPNSIKKICISDPGNLLIYFEQCLLLCSFVRKAFPKAEIEFLFHRGNLHVSEYYSEKIVKKATELKNKIENMGIECEDISYGYEKLSVYDDCDLHIGYRVHAHIYNMSRKGISVLLEEDARGAGVNDALNLRHIKAYNHKVKVPGKNKIIKTVCNSNIIKEIEAWLERGFQTDFIDYEMAYRLMEGYYEKMIKHIETFV